MAMSASAPSAVVRELNSLPLSKELLEYYHDRLSASEQEMREMVTRVDAVANTQEAQHKIQWESQKRMDEVTDLQKALSDSHVYLWEEREKVQRQQAEIDELKMQEVEDRRKIQHLLSLAHPVVQDTTYVRDTPPDTVTIHPHARAKTTSVQRPATSSHRTARIDATSATGAVGGGGGGGVRVGGGKGGGGGDDAASRVLRTVYLPNEQVDSLLLTIESLRARIQEQEQLGRERVAALLEDRRLRTAEERARRAAEGDKAAEAAATLKRTQDMLTRYTKDYLTLKHNSLCAHRQVVETLEAVKAENGELRAELERVKGTADKEVAAVTASTRAAADQHVQLYRQQMGDMERTMGLLKDQHNGLQQALAMRVKELETVVARLRAKYTALDKRRGLEAEGFERDLALMHKQVRRLELKAFGQRVGMTIENRYNSHDAPAAGKGAAKKAAQSAKALSAMKARVEGLENALLADSEPWPL